MSDKKPDFSNVVGGSSSTAETAPSATVGPPEPRFYVVQKGDTLSKIAKQFYGEASGWRRIFNANKDQIKDPDLIQPGWKLTIPEEGEDKGGVA